MFRYRRVVAGLLVVLAAGALAKITLAGSTGAAASAAYSNPGVIQIPAAPNTSGIANPYPSQIVVSGGPMSIASMTVVLNGLSHTFLSDVDMMLESPSPGSTNATFFSDICGSGGSQTATNLTYTLDDTAATALAGSGECPTVAPASGTYKPTNNAPAETFNAPAPAAVPGNVLFSSFNGLNSNGTWNLWVQDDAGGDAGSLAQGWTITLAGPPTAVGVASLSAVRAPGSVVVRWATRSETSIAGFDLFRSSVRSTVKVNRTLIAARHEGRPTSAAYRFVDRRASRSRSWTYRLRVAKLDGSSSWYGGVSSISPAP